MSRAPNENAIKAKQLYDKGMKLVEIANQLNIPSGTVRRWKSTYKWDNEQNERSGRKTNARIENNEPIAKEVDSVLENTELTDKQRLFCLYFIKSFNATKAYQKAYKCDYVSAMQNGSRMLRNDKVKKEINRLKEERLNREFISESDIFQKYIDIAYSDMTDYMEWGTDEEGVSYAKFTDSTTVDGTIVTEFKIGKNSTSIKLSDKMKALDWLTAHMSFATPEQKVKMELIQAQIDKINGIEPDRDERVVIVNDLEEYEDSQDQ